MSEAIRRNDLAMVGGKRISVTVNSRWIVAVLEYTSEADLRRARGILRNRNWSVVETSGLRIKLKARVV